VRPLSPGALLLPPAPETTPTMRAAALHAAGLKPLWSKAKPMNCSEVLLEQARRTKAQNNATHVFVYQNLVKALPWMTPVREKLEDPRFWGFFLKKKNATGTDATGVLYHDTTSQPVSGDCGQDVQCGEYLWDVRKPPLTIMMQCGLSLYAPY
jgi:hypothetical protein